MKKILFSGDLGRFPQLILRAPATPEDEFDYMLLESTYGDRLHPRDDVGAHLASIVEATAERGGTVVIPSFAVGRTQELLYLFRELIEQRKMHSLPIHVDSPMAIDVTDLYRRHQEDYDLKTGALEAKGIRPFSPPNLHFDKSVEESKALNEVRYPMVIISASGMATGGAWFITCNAAFPTIATPFSLWGFKRQAHGASSSRLVNPSRCTANSLTSGRASKPSST